MKGKSFSRTQYIGLVLLLVLIITPVILNYYVKMAASPYILPADELPPADAILVLGAYVLPDGSMSSMLADRISVGYGLYQSDKAPKILVSGDHGRKDYDEVNTMKAYLKHQGIPTQNIFMDHAGFSTYESMYRAREVFKVRKVIIVTQQYHLMRAVFIARELGLEAYGTAADLHSYGDVMPYNELREIAARNKDFWMCKVFKPQPTYLGEPIPVFGDGRATDDREEDPGQSEQK
ncbi:MAG: vancomycin high temperature exclusion protein [Deltaproteobacteria bacterium]